jgi:superfamily II DNA/RNA helicase
MFEQFRAISASQEMKVALVTGGGDMREQALKLAARPHVVIATPGRLADHVRSSGEDTLRGFRRTRMVVIDEADRVLASGPGSMLPDLEECLSVVPPPQDRQTLLFTATVTPEVHALMMKPRRGPAHRASPAATTTAATAATPLPASTLTSSTATATAPIPTAAKVDGSAVFVCDVVGGAGSNGGAAAAPVTLPPTLAQHYLPVPPTLRESYLHVLLQTRANAAHAAVVVFCNRARTADLLARTLRLLGHRVAALHAALPQRERAASLARFRARAARVLVATDVAARGLDVPDVGLVVNFDVPRDADDYVHRVGRAARAGRRGRAVTLLGPRDVHLLLAIEARVGRKMGEYVEYEDGEVLDPEEAAAAATMNVGGGATVAADGSTATTDKEQHGDANGEDEGKKTKKQKEKKNKRRRREEEGGKNAGGAKNEGARAPATATTAAVAAAAAAAATNSAARKPINIEARVIRDALKVVGEKKREAALEMEEDRDTGGRKRPAMLTMRNA